METKERELEKPAFKFVFTTGDFSESHKHGVIVAINLNHSVIPSGWFVCPDENNNSGALEGQNKPTEEVNLTKHSKGKLPSGYIFS